MLAVSHFLAQPGHLPRARALHNDSSFGRDVDLQWGAWPAAGFELEVSASFQVPCNAVHGLAGQVQPARDLRYAEAWALVRDADHACLGMGQAKLFQCVASDPLQA